MPVALDDTTWEISSPTRVPADEVLRALENVGVVRLRGLCSPREIADGLARVRTLFDCASDQASVGGDPSAVRGNYQKLSVGTAAGPHRSDSYARLLRVLFNPLIASDIYGLHSLFRSVAEVRNVLMGLPPGFACSSIESGLFTASRLQHYPRGGGFLSAHRDQTSAANVGDGVRRYLQPIIVLTKRGVDYERGGAFIERDGIVTDIEDQVEVGDVVVYDGSLLHGVDDIDPHRVLDLATLTGRLAGLVTLYRSL